MSLVNKSFKNKITGDTFTIIDVYQNVAITDNKEKIDTKLLMNDKLFSPVSGEVRESFSFKKNEESVDPQRFFENQNAYNYLAETIKKIDTSRIKEENQNSNTNYPNSDFNVSNESAIVYSDPQDEIEELKRKYGATSVDDSLRKQNEAFARILDPQEEVQSIEVPRSPAPQEQQEYPVSQPIQRIEAVDPVTSMFRNVKRNLDFNINLKIEGKIPRLDFIEMMEDSYEISIIEYLAEEFTNNLLSDPSIIRNKIISEIKSMIDNKNVVEKNPPSSKPTPPPSQQIKEGQDPKPVAQIKPERKVPEVKKEDRELLNEGLPSPVKNRRKKAVPPPTPPATPKSRFLKEGQEPEPPKNMSV
jgi:hypothetical protein